MGNISCSDWQHIAARKRQELSSKIPAHWRLSQKVLDDAKKQRRLTGKFIESLLDKNTRKITSLDSPDIVESIRNKSFTSVEVTRAFCKRTAIAHQLNNNLLEIFFDSALARAVELDAYLVEHNKTVGPLHGLPVSLKDQYHVKGFDTSMGYVGWIGTFEGDHGTGKEAFVESELVRELNVLGAVPIALTNVVQTLWFSETNNNIVGYTMCPHNQILSAGGSSGGQGALQALRGTTVGFGTDTGGSVSMPAAFNGLYSIKPSFGRIPMKDVADPTHGQSVIRTVPGIMGTSLTSLSLVLKSLLSTRPWLHDPSVVKIDWREAQEVDPAGSNNLAFGFMESDQVVNPHPPIARALRIVAKALRDEGHKLLAWEPPAHSEGAVLHHNLINGDGDAYTWKQLGLSGEPLIPELVPEFGDGPFPPIPILDFFESTLSLEKYRTKYQTYWQSTLIETGTGRPVDAVILPVAPHAGLLPGKFYHYDYSIIASVLDYTTIVIPVTTADKAIDVFDPEYIPLNEKDRQNWEAYDAEKYDGGPASIQLLGRRFEEEKLLSIARVVVEALKASGHSKL